MTAVAHPTVTLTTDFGEDSPYVAAMKGVLLSINSAVQILDLSHQIPPQDVRHAAFFLASAVPHFPAEVLHVVVVDPGVGSDRALLYVETAGHRLLVPDNGCWTELARAAEPSLVIRLAEPRFWRPSVSRTFHGRDILAPVAGHLTLGVDPRELGPIATEWARLDLARAEARPDGWAGEVVFVDHFGNLITNLPGLLWQDRGVRFFVGEREIPTRVSSYAEALPGTPVVLPSSNGALEVAVAQGSAAALLQAGVGTPVQVLKPAAG